MPTPNSPSCTIEFCAVSVEPETNRMASRVISFILISGRIMVRKKIERKNNQFLSFRRQYLNVRIRQTGLAKGCTELQDVDRWRVWGHSSINCAYPYPRSAYYEVFGESCFR